MSLRTTLLVTCAVIATTAGVRSQDAAPSAPAVAASPSADPGDALRAAGLGDLAPAAPAALELSQIAPKPAARAAAPEAATLDLSALWYFATQKDFGRVAAEIKLIRRTHPDWTPPADLFSAAEGGGPEEQPLWDLFAKQDFDGVHAGIDALRRERPDWTPSANLQGKLALAEARAALMKASDAKDWAGVVTIATANKMLLTCKDLESLWRTAEALGRAGDEARATETYRYTLTNCAAPHDRLATVQKASTVLQSAASLDALLQLGRKQADGSREFDALRLDRVRGLLGQSTEDRTLPGPSQVELDLITELAKKPAGQADAQLLGWFNYAHKQYAAAHDWFKQALSAGQSPEAAKGLVLSTRAQGDVETTRQEALAYAGLGIDNRKIMIEVLSGILIDPNGASVPDDQIATFSQAVDELKAQDGARALAFYADGKHDKKASADWGAKAIQWKGEEIDATRSVDGAVALGWELFKSNNFAGAEPWFQKSAEWEPNESAAIGLVLTAHRLGHMNDFAARLAEYSVKFPAVAELKVPVAVAQRPAKVHVAARRPMPKRSTDGSNWDKSADQIIETFRGGNYQQAVAMLDQRRSTRNEPRGLTVVRGWALYHKGDWDGAERVFSSLDGGRYSDERAVGLRVIESGYTNPRYR